jgi:hypothetical protein
MKKTLLIKVFFYQNTVHASYFANVFSMGKVIASVSSFASKLKLVATVSLFISWAIL